jgi:hypothetical protein
MPFGAEAFVERQRLEHAEIGTPLDDPIQLALLAVHFGRFWHKADIALMSANVRFGG